MFLEVGRVPGTSAFSGSQPLCFVKFPGSGVSIEPVPSTRKEKFQEKFLQTINPKSADI